MVVVVVVGVGGVLGRGGNYNNLVGGGAAGRLLDEGNDEVFSGFIKFIITRAQSFFMIASQLICI